MPRLNNEQKVFIIERLARFDSPSEVAKELNEAYGIELPANRIVFYDPTTAHGAELGKKWKALFEQLRKRFTEDLSGIASTHKAFRIRRLEALARNAEKKRNAKLAAELYEQIAKECGGAYTNKRELSGSLGVTNAQVSVYVPDNKRAGG